LFHIAQLLTVFIQLHNLFTYQQTKWNNNNNNNKNKNNVLARALHRLLEWKNHGLVWPTMSGSVIDLVTTIVKRINEASGIYQMYRMLGDVILLRG
jgi:hypothetical protein